MAKVVVKKVPKKHREGTLRKLAAVLTQVADEKTMIAILKQLLTESEIIMLGRRLEIAARLRQGESYLQIRESLGVGLATIQVVARWLEGIEESLPKNQQFQPARLTINTVGFHAQGADTFGARTTDLLVILDLVFSLFDSKPSKPGNSKNSNTGKKH